MLRRQYNKLASEADIHHLFNYVVGAREWRVSKVFTLT